MNSKILIVFLILILIVNSCEDDEPNFYLNFIEINKGNVNIEQNQFVFQKEEKFALAEKA